MSVLLEEVDCLSEPILHMTLSTAKVKKDYPDFDFSSLANKFIELGFNFDGRYFEKYEGSNIEYTKVTKQSPLCKSMV